jgi:hypothetical protein
MSLQLAKLLYTYDMKLVDKEQDWLAQCALYVLWWKPELRIDFTHAEHA